MNKFQFSKFMEDIIKREKPRNDIQEASETPQEELRRLHRENYRHLLKWNKVDSKK